MKNLELLKKIKKNILLLGEFYEEIADCAEEDVSDSKTGLAITQVITNISSFYGYIDDSDIIQILATTEIIRIKSVRNIAAHDYDTIDWVKVKDCVLTYVTLYFEIGGLCY